MCHRSGPARNPRTRTGQHAGENVTWGGGVYTKSQQALNLDQNRVEHLVASRPNPLYNTASSKSRPEQIGAHSGDQIRVEHLVASRPNPLYNTASSKSRPEQIGAHSGEQSIAPSAGKTQPSISIHQALNLGQIRVKHLVAWRQDPTLTINTPSSKSRPEQSNAPSGGKTQPSLSIHQALNLDQNRVKHLVATRSEYSTLWRQDPTLNINTPSSKSRPEQSRAPSGGKTQPSLSIQQALNLGQHRVEHLVAARPNPHYQYSKL
ncbi:hypothetical protein RRG08_051303 [Elysia crispata]|uniref:Uncharacterized protein n=1 Tax=Elysia crispata TaxID=231223 RepID=A0AAE1CL30_9GAST|nr:hypothetical protein RRG08_051303 [Elysia crispata]